MLAIFNGSGDWSCYCWPVSSMNLTQRNEVILGNRFLIGTLSNCVMYLSIFCITYFINYALWSTVYAGWVQIMLFEAQCILAGFKWCSLKHSVCSWVQMILFEAQCMQLGSNDALWSTVYAAGFKWCSLRSTVYAGRVQMMLFETQCVKNGFKWCSLKRRVCRLGSNYALWNTVYAGWVQMMLFEAQCMQAGFKLCYLKHSV